LALKCFFLNVPTVETREGLSPSPIPDPSDNQDGMKSRLDFNALSLKKGSVFKHYSQKTYSGKSARYKIN